MTKRRYIAWLATDPAAGDHWRRRLKRASRSTDDLVIRLDRQGCILLSQTPPIMIGLNGAIVGDCMRTGSADPVDSLSESESAAIAATNGQALIDCHWGGYVALLLRADGSADVIRAPMGDLACYMLAVAGGLLIASDIELLMQFAGYRPSPNWTAIADHLLAGDLRQSTTCLTDVRELTGGERLSAGTSSTVAALWTPWSVAMRRTGRNSIPPSPEELRRTVCMAIAARASRVERSVLLLSGGLDSSIVAAALSRWRCRAEAVTMVAHDQAGDERLYARATASHLALPLHEIERRVETVDITQSTAAGLPYPADRSFTQATSLAATDLAARIGATAILHGGGGDHVFCSVQSAAPVTDLLRRRRVGPRLRRTVESIATIAQVTRAAVMRQAVWRLFRQGPIVRVHPICDLLSGDALQRATVATHHPWLDAPPGALPGTAAHVANVVRAQSIVQSPDARAPLPSVAVLLAQPIVEACLAVPSWDWLDDGHNRAHARHAFAEMLPAPVAWRRSKGALNGFMVEIFEANRSLLRSFLLEGRLAASGLIDRAALEAALAQPGPVRGDNYGRILDFADVEAWLRSWPG